MQYLTAMILQIIYFKSHTAQAGDFNDTSLSVTCCPSLSGLPSSCFQRAIAGTTFGSQYLTTAAVDKHKRSQVIHLINKINNYNVY